jgi:hypothetical protein
MKNVNFLSVFLISALAACGKDFKNPKLVQEGVSPEQVVGSNGRVMEALKSADTAKSAAAESAVNKEVTQCLSDQQKKSIPSRIWRLTSEQYAKTLSTLFPSATPYDNPFAAEPSASYGFNNGVDAMGLSPQQFSNVIASAAKNTPLVLKALQFDFPCLAVSPLADKCAIDAAHMARTKLIRRDLTAEEKKQVSDDFLAQKASGGGANALALLVEANLSSPLFLFRQEIGLGGRLDGFEMATFISYSVTDGPPDSALLSSARNGELKDPAKLKAHVVRLLEATNGERIVFFVESLLGLRRISQGDTTQGLTADVRKQILEHLRKQLKTQISESKLTLSDLFSSQFDLGLKTSTVDLTGSRFGLLQHPAFVASIVSSKETDPVHRGITVLENVFCDPLPPAPPEAADVVLVESSTLTMREKMAIHTSNPACATCHNKIDPIGLSLEQFDFRGQIRSSDKGKLLAFAGSLELGGTKIEFKDSTEFTQSLSKSKRVAQCMTKMAVEFNLGRSADKVGDCGTLEVLSESLLSPDKGLVDLFVGTLTSEVFLTRGL